MAVNPIPLERPYMPDSDMSDLNKAYAFGQAAVQNHLQLEQQRMENERMAFENQKMRLLGPTLLKWDHEIKKNEFARSKLILEDQIHKHQIERERYDRIMRHRNNVHNEIGIGNGKEDETDSELAFDEGLDDEQRAIGSLTVNIREDDAIAGLPEPQVEKPNPTVIGVEKVSNFKSRGGLSSPDDIPFPDDMAPLPPLDDDGIETKPPRWSPMHPDNQQRQLSTPTASATPVMEWWKDQLDKKRITTHEFVKAQDLISMSNGPTEFNVVNETRDRLKSRDSSPGNRIVSLDYNSSKGVGNGYAMIVIPDDATDEERVAAQRYVQATHNWFQNHGVELDKPVVKTAGNNKRGVRGFFHTEPAFEQNRKALALLHQKPEEYAKILADTLGTLPGVTFIPPHTSIDTGAASARGFHSERELARKELIPALWREREQRKEAASELEKMRNQIGSSSERRSVDSDSTSDWWGDSTSSDDLWD